MIEIRSYDRWVLLATIALVLLGTVMVYSSTSVITPALEIKHVSEFQYLRKHLVTVFMGIIALYLAYVIDRERLKRIGLPLLVISFLLLLLVFVPGLGIKAGGARRWLRLWPSTFQPSELAKLAMVIFLAGFLSSREFRMTVNDEGRDEDASQRPVSHFYYFLVPVAVMFGFQGVFLVQPDFGAAMSLGVLTLCVLFISGIRLSYLCSLMLLALPAIAYLLMKPYRMKRIITFLDPWEHRHDSGFQLVQSFIAFGSGGLTGVGLGKSHQKLDFLPEVHTDFIFSMVGEELGFVIALIVIGAFALIFVRGLIIASRWQEGSFEYYLGFGLSLMIALQALVNVAVVTGMLPTKGLPLPFISYGGSSMIVNMAAVGLLLNLSTSGGLNESYTSSGGSSTEEKFGALIERKKARRAVLRRGRA